MPGIDQYDYDLQARKQRPDFNFIISFKSILNALTLIMDTVPVEEADSRYPKSPILKCFLGEWLMVAAFGSFCYNILLLATVPFLGFYIYTIVKTCKAWTHYRYSKGGLVLIVIGGMIVSVGIAVLVQLMVFY